MANIEYKNKALKIYNAGYLRPDRGSVPGVREYCESLCGAIIDEYITQGFCTLIDYFIENRKDVDEITYFSFMAAEQRLNSQSKLTPGTSVVISEKSLIRNPYRTQQVSWEELEARTIALMRRRMVSAYQFQEVGKFIKTLKEAGQHQHLMESGESEKKERKETDDNVIKNDEIEIRKSRMLSDAENEAKKIKDTAETEAARIKREAETAAMKIKEEAEAEAGRIKGDAEAEAKRTKNDAKIEAERIIQVASDGTKEKEAALNQEAIEKENKVKNLIKTYLSNEKESLRDELGKEYAGLIEKSNQTLGVSEKIHDDMCDQTNRLQAAWVNALETAVNDMTALKEDFYKHLRKWQVALYPHELRPLAERYLELYRIVNVDKLITAEIMRMESAENEASVKQDNEQHSRFSLFGRNERKDTKDQENSVNTSGTSTILEGLNKLDRNLTTFLHKFEVSLRGFDIYIYFPKQGDIFDNVWHVVEDDTDFDYSSEHRIEHCVLPGVARKVLDSGDDDVLIPAVVVVAD